MTGQKEYLFIVVTESDTVIDLSLIHELREFLPLSLVPVRGVVPGVS